jgi:hypothetical protein
MNTFIIFLTTASFIASTLLREYAVESSSAPPSQVVLAAVARDRGLLKGGIGPGSRTSAGRVVAEPFVRLSETGQFTKLPCQSDETKQCEQFAREYLSKPHIYSIVSPDGYEATVHADAARLSECNDYVGGGTYSGAPLRRSAVAAATGDFFVAAPPLTLLGAKDTAAVGKLLKRVMAEKLTSAKNLQAWSVNLGGHDVVVVQRAYEDVQDQDSQRGSLVFTIGELERLRFHVLHWKRNTDDEEERVLGTIKLQSGQDFLVSVVSHPEGHFYRIYSFQQNQLKVVYQGGGSSC